MLNYKVLISEEQIRERVNELAEQISKDYEGKKPIVVCTLKGAVYFFTDLTRRLNIPIQVDFARLSSYRSGTTSGEMQLMFDITTNIAGKDVIIVEDIIDSGKTLAYFIELLKKRNPASIKTCTFLDKTSRREVDLESDYYCFKGNFGFVIGYGMDFAENYRELPFLAEVAE